MFSEMSDRERQILYVKSKKLKQYIKKLKKTIYKNINQNVKMIRNSMTQ